MNAKNWLAKASLAGVSLAVLAGCAVVPPPPPQAATPVVDPQALKLAQKAVDYAEVRNVISRYSDYYFENDFDNVARLFALDRDDTSYKTPMGPTGGKAIAEAFARRKANYEQGKDPVGQLHVHPNSTPIIEIAGDGQTAKGVFDSFGPDIACVNEVGNWLYIRKAVDFIKEPDGWKIWHMQDYPVFDTPYNRSITQHAIDQAKSKGGNAMPSCISGGGKGVMPAGMKPPAGGQAPGQASVKLWIYDGKTVQPLGVPKLPVPYETFDPKDAY
jgi:hypothetical protein